MSKRVFLTGSTGFVGLPLVRLLAQEDYEVHALAQNEREAGKLTEFRNSMTVHTGDLLNPETCLGKIRDLRPDLVLHLAWITTPGVYLTSPDNAKLVEGSLRLAEAAASSGCRRFVGIGTCFEYAFGADRGTLSESSPTCPRTPYATAKLDLYQKLSALSARTGMSFAWPRLFYLYGPGEHPNRLVPTLIRSMMSGTPAPMTDGGKIRDYLHVEDVAAAVLAIAKSEVTGPVNVGSGIPVTLRDLAQTISNLFGKTADETCRFGALADNPHDPKRVVADTRKLRESTSWTPKYSLDDGLRRTAEWWKTQKAPPLPASPSKGEGLNTGEGK